MLLSLVAHGLNQFDKTSDANKKFIRWKIEVTTRKVIQAVYGLVLVELIKNISEGER